jgi:hypothetical protein
MENLTCPKGITTLHVNKIKSKVRVFAGRPHAKKKSSDDVRIPIINSNFDKRRQTIEPRIIKAKLEFACL